MIDLENLPTETGVYLMKDKSGNIIYIGKAKNLKVRVKNYFLGQDSRPQVKFLVERVASLETIITGTEEQSLLLERDLINKHKPRYNIRLKDDKNYLSIRIDPNSAWPRPQLVRRIEQDGAKYFGPFTGTNQARELLEIINKTIPLRSCSNTVFYNRQRPCIEYQIKRCAGPCCLDVSEEDYQNWLKQAMDLLNGKTDRLINQLENQMESASENLFFEDAALARDRIELLKSFKLGQKYISNGVENRDIFAIYREESLATVSVMQVRNGRISNNNNYSFEELVIDNRQLMQAVMEQYYHESQANNVPDELVVEELPENPELIQAMLKKQVQQKINIFQPQRGVKYRLVKLAELNARKYFDLRFNFDSRIQIISEQLKKICQLSQVPRRIECIDISNLQGSDIVGALVSFYDGRPDKQGYRKYKISFQDTPNDFAAIKEVVGRRLKLAMEQVDFPDLLIIDGGRAQLQYAQEAIEELKLSIDVIALAKEKLSTVRGSKVRKQERVYLVGASQPIVLKPQDELTKFIASIRDEVHRFVITFHRQQRGTRFLASKLDEITGVGPKRSKQLVSAFGSVENIKTASEEEIANTAGVSLWMAKKIKNGLH